MFISKFRKKKDRNKAKSESARTDHAAPEHRSTSITPSSGHSTAGPSLINTPSETLQRPEISLATLAADSPSNLGRTVTDLSVDFAKSTITGRDVGNNNFIDKSQTVDKSVNKSQIINLTNHFNASSHYEQSIPHRIVRFSLNFKLHGI
jgi:hypothetical protein